jgi:hypothetical protein
VFLANAWRQVRGSDFRVYVHSPRAMDTLLRQLGLQRIRSDATIVWSIEIWERAP